MSLTLEVRSIHQRLQSSQQFPLVIFKVSDLLHIPRKASSIKINFGFPAHLDGIEAHFYYALFCGHYISMSHRPSCI